MEFGKGEHRVQAVSGVRFEVRAGETLGLVGESGCGKSTLSRALLHLYRPRQGRVIFDGVDLGTLSARELRRMRRRLQLILQDPVASLNPRRRVGEIVAEPLVIAGAADATERRRRVREVLAAVGLDADAVTQRRPHELSGGQCQRVSIARTLVLEPQLVVCDEPVSALDVSIRAQIINLLEAMKARYGLTLIFVAHDLGVVRAVSDRVAVMYLGRICEIGDADTVFRRPAHPYTSTLLTAIPVPDPDMPRPRVTGRVELPSPLDPPSGCRFRTRCPRAEPLCGESTPGLRPMGEGREVACHFPNEGSGV